MAQPLGEHLGDPIIRTKVAITGAGDGLSKALAIDPQVIGRDEQVYVVIRCALKDHKLEWFEDPDEQIGGWELTNRLRAGLATIVDPEVVADLLEAQQRKLDEAAGIARLPLDGVGAPDSEDVGSELESHVAELANRRKRKGEADLVSIEEVADGS